MKKKLAVLLLGLLSISLLLFVGCSGGKVVFSGVSAEYNLKAAESEYDFLDGVSATQGGKDTKVKVDTSAVEFGKAGEYTITFSAGKEKITAKVKIYGMPTYTAEDITIGYGTDALQGVVCKDSFGNDLEVTHSEFEKDSLGRILYKTHEITYTAQDVAGNTVEFSRKVTITDTALTMIKDKTVDLADASINWIVGQGSELVSVRLLKEGGAEDVAAENYTFTAGVGRFEFDPEYLASLETGKAHAFDFTFSTGYKTVKITVTDNETPAYTVDGDIDGAEFCEGKITLPETVKNAGSYQKIEIEYRLNDQVVTDLDAELTEDEYEYKILYKRGGGVIQEATVTMNFTVMAANEYYGRAIQGERFQQFWNVMITCDNRPATADNRVEMATVDGKSAYHMINDLVGHQDDCRGFYLDMNYLDGIRRAGFTHLSITYKLELDKDGRNNFFIDYYETDPQKYYNGKDRWRGGNGEYWGKAAEMKDEWVTVTIPMNESATSQLFFLAESQGFYIESVVPAMRAAYVAEVRDTDAFGMEVAVQCGNDTLPNLKLFYNAKSNSAESALESNWISVGNGIAVEGCGDIVPTFTSHKDGWGSADATNAKRFEFPRLTDPSRGVHNNQSGKAYIRWQIVNGAYSATLEIYYFFSKGNSGFDHSGEYEKVLSVGNLPLLKNGYAGFIVNDKKESDPNLTEFLFFNGVSTAEKISEKGAVIDFNTQCALSDQLFSIRFFYNAKDTNFASVKTAPSIFFANGTGANGNLVKAENVDGTVSFSDLKGWGSANGGANSYNFLAFRDAHLKSLHDGNSGRAYVRLVICNDSDGKATLSVYIDNRTNTDLGKGSQLLVLQIKGLDAVEEGYAGILIDDSVFSSHWFEKNIWYTEGFKVTPYEPAYMQNIAQDTGKITMMFGAQCGESLRKIRLFYNADSNTAAGVASNAGVLFEGDTVSAIAAGSVTFEDEKDWGSASETANAYNLLHMQKAHEKRYHDPNNGIVTVKIEIENSGAGAVLKMYFKDPASEDFDLILTVSGLDAIGGGYAGLVIDDNIIDHKHIKDFSIN